MITLNEVWLRVQRIRELSDSGADAQALHSMEDDLHREVLQAIADGSETPMVLATHALKTREIEFARYAA